MINITIIQVKILVLSLVLKTLLINYFSNNAVKNVNFLIHLYNLTSSKLVVIAFNL